MKCDTELWPSEMAFKQAMQRMLITMNGCPSMDAAEVAPLCLSKDQLASLVDPEEREVNSLLMVDGWFESFTQEGDSDLMCQAMDRWRKSLNKARKEFDWSKLPPTAHQHATKQANDLLTKATAENWIERCDQGLQWSITQAGRLAIRKVY